MRPVLDFGPEYGNVTSVCPSASSGANSPRPPLARCTPRRDTLCLAQRRDRSIAERRGADMDTIERTAPSQAKLLEELPLRLHHNAYVVKDHEANRRFLEDLLGIPLIATWCEKTFRGDL